MARACIDSGARGVVASLWQVEDSAAAETMAAFYEILLRRGIAPARALHLAQLRLRRSGTPRDVRVTDLGRVSSPSAHPSQWAPFVYLGRVH